MDSTEFVGRVWCISKANSWHRHIATITFEKGLCNQYIGGCARKGHGSFIAAATRVSSHKNYIYYFNTHSI